MQSQPHDPVERAREKESSRAEDARAIVVEEKSPELLRDENALFAFRNVRIGIPIDER